MATVGAPVGLGPLPRDLARRLTLVEREARALGRAVWWAGGGVRDLLLGRSAERSDLDLVLESDPLELARALGAALGGRIVEHPEFLTVTLESAAGGRIDFARARSESYPRPGALPVVAPAPLERDLERRDFTLNAMAVPVRVPVAGLVDPFAGRLDLEAGRLRVLHAGSFLDDPTRILRGVRFELRFGFRFEADTERLARAALGAGALASISGERLRRELELLFEGWDRGAPSLRRLAELGAIEALGAARPSRRALQALDAAGPVAASLPWADGGLSAPTPWRVTRLALLLAADPAGAAKPLEGLVEPTERARRVGERLAAAEALAASARRPSEIARALDPLDPAELLWLALGSDRAAGQVEGFLVRGRALRLAITGRDLVEAGVEEGPAIGLALDETRRARLDGVIDAEGELDFALGRARAGGQP